ncbi:carnitine/acylcarnitine carrier protein [Tribonema minus]|uniref:Carnitine/acylcarnitine carrier protein n=1 Tax=Tribonema minus TaxID=303371 RepID=A0A836C8G7_9STRA|nr:carnitine/acylcarnitine carrier protein [Tribonema minus]
MCSEFTLQTLLPLNHAQVKSLYRGLASPVLGYGVLFAMSFSANGQALRYLRNRDGRAANAPASVAEMTLAGAWAGAVQAPARQVFERVKGVMQVRNGAGGKAPYSWSGACLVDLVRTEGVQMGLFRGMGSQFIREVPQFALYYPAYDVAKRAILPADGHISPIHMLLAGGIAGTVQWLPPIYNIDVLKTKIQTAAPGTYKSIADAARKTVATEGTKGLFRGLGPSLVRAFPLHATIFAGYELTMAHLHS